jgi:hypothetical protein
MDFLERIFHLNLDGGSGLSEFNLLVAILIAIVIFGMGRKPAPGGER